MLCALQAPYSAGVPIILWSIYAWQVSKNIKVKGAPLETMKSHDDSANLQSSGCFLGTFGL